MNIFYSQELLNVTLPLINYNSLKRKVGQLIASKTSRSDQTAPQLEPTLTINTTCAICSQRPVIPHHIQCIHVFCYYCIKGSVMADPEFSCPVCDFSYKDEIHPVVVNIE